MFVNRMGHHCINRYNPAASCNLADFVFILVSFFKPKTRLLRFKGKGLKEAVSVKQNKKTIKKSHTNFHGLNGTLGSQYQDLVY